MLDVRSSLHNVTPFYLLAVALFNANGLSEAFLLINGKLTPQKGR